MAELANAWLILLVLAFLVVFIWASCRALALGNSPYIRNYTPNLRIKKSKYESSCLKFLNLLVGLAFGFILVQLQFQYSPFIHDSLFNQQVVLQGEIVSLPEINSEKSYNKYRFNFELERIDLIKGNSKSAQSWRGSGPKVAVSWYINKREMPEEFALPKVGQQWQLVAKLKPNHASMNLGARDYEAWLFQQHLVAKATVSGLNKEISGQILSNKLMVQASLVNWRVWRSQLSDYLEGVFKQSEYYAIYRALLIGDKSQISSSEWLLFQETGTIHLMAISGLHMSIMAAIGYLFAKFLWYLFVFRQQKLIFPVFAAFVSALFASAYLLVSGGAIPTQRAWIMVVTVIIFLSLRRQFQPWTALAMAALLIVVWDSRAILSSGFWLSFMAVALIFSALEITRMKKKWSTLIYLQIALSLGLIPIIAWHYYEIPLYGSLANLIAVPFMTAIALPLLLLIVFVGLLSEGAALWLVEVSDFLWDLLFASLNWVADLPVLDLGLVQHSVVWLLACYFGVWVIWKVFKKWPARSQVAEWVMLLVLAVYIAVVLLLPYPLNRPNNSGRAWITTMDVGQGQAIVIETSNHLVIYDVAARWGKTTEVIKFSVLPYLKAQGWNQVDVLTVSHSDIDHSGGIQSVLQEFHINRALSGQPNNLNQMLKTTVQRDKNTEIRFEQCQSGQAWEFDGVHFEVLSPNQELINDSKIADNDLSCVLKVSTGQVSALIMGDLSSRFEAQLQHSYHDNPQGLKSHLLIAGHHGSRYSTSSKWLATTQPQHVVFSAGYMNRFKFPSSDVIERIKLQDSQIKWWNTACSGALAFEMSSRGVKLRYEARKKQRKWYHHSCSESLKGVYYQ